MGNGENAGQVVNIVKNGENAGLKFCHLVKISM